MSKSKRTKKAKSSPKTKLKFLLKSGGFVYSELTDLEALAETFTPTLHGLVVKVPGHTSTKRIFVPRDNISCVYEDVE